MGTRALARDVRFFRSVLPRVCCACAVVVVKVQRSGCGKAFGVNSNMPRRFRMRFVGAPGEDSDEGDDEVVVEVEDGAYGWRSSQSRVLSLPSEDGESESRSEDDSEVAAGGDEVISGGVGTASTAVGFT